MTSRDAQQGLYCCHNGESSELTRRIRAEFFVFELEAGRPYRLVKGEFERVGRMHCRLRAGTRDFDALMLPLDRASAYFEVGGRALSGGFRDQSAAGDDVNFSKQVTIRPGSAVRHRLGREDLYRLGYQRLPVYSLGVELVLTASTRPLLEITYKLQSATFC